MHYTLQEIASAAKRLHWNYGRGDVIEVRTFADGCVELDASCGRFCKLRTYRGRLVNEGRSVRLHGHQTRIEYLQEV